MSGQMVNDKTGEEQKEGAPKFGGKNHYATFATHTFISSQSANLWPQ